jgi:AmmeMemoRadiSam system protein B
MNKKVTFCVIGALAVIAVAVTLLKFNWTDNVGGQVNGISLSSEEQSSVKSSGFEYDNLIKQSLDETKTAKDWPTAKLGVTSHHLPTAAGFISEFYNSLPQTAPKTVVIVGPDHFERCRRAVSTTRLPYYTPYGMLDSNTTIISDLVNSGDVMEVVDCFDGEHSIGVHATFVKLMYPESNIVPIIYSSAASDEDVQKVTAVLDKYRQDITVIFSVDFSHYQAVELANQLDNDSGNMIRKLNGDGLALKHMDSPPSIRTAIALAKLWNLKPQMLRHANSYEFTGESQNTTGYWNIVFTP